MFHWWLRMFSNSLNVFWQFEIVPLRIICLALYPIFKLDCLVFWASFLQFFLYFGDHSSVRCGIGEDLFPFCRLSFSLIDCVLCLTEAFQFQEVIHWLLLSMSLLLLLYVWSGLLCQCVQGYFPPSPLSGSEQLDICCGHWSIGTWVLCMAEDLDLFVIFYMLRPVIQHHLLKIILFCTVYFDYLVQNQLFTGVWINARVFIWFHWSMCLILCQYQVVFITIALWWSFKSGMVMSLEVLLLYMIVLIILRIFFCFSIRSWILFYNSVSNCVWIMMGISFNL